MLGRSVRRTTLLLLTTGSALAQTSILQSLNPLSATTNGIHLYGVTVSSGYFSGSYAGNIGISPIHGSATTPSLMGMVTASIGWTRETRRSGISVVYSPSYVRGFHFQDFHAFNDSLAVNIHRDIGVKWRLGVSLSAVRSDYSELLFSPTRYGNIVSTPASFDELAGAVLTGTTTNSALASVVSAANTVTSPENAYVYGARELSSAAQVGLSYQQSDRSAFYISMAGSRTQSLAQSGKSGNYGYYVPKTSAASLGLGWSYRLTPRTNLGVSVSSGRTFSKYLDAYVNEGSISIGHTLSRRWFASGSVGIGYISPIHQSVALTRTMQYLYNVGIGFKTYTQTFLGSYSRSVSDTYGLGADATESSSAGWNWKRPGQSLSLYATFGYMRLISPHLPSVGSWTESCGATQGLGQHFSLSASYTHVSFPGGLLPVDSASLSQYGVMLTLGWSPSVRR